jgi:hypothetical protein
MLKAERQSRYARDLKNRQRDDCQLKVMYNDAKDILVLLAAEGAK